MDRNVMPNRRDALTFALGGSALALAGSRAQAQAKRVEMLVAYYGALINTGVVAVGLESGFYKTAQIEVTDAVASMGGGTAVRNMIGGGIEYAILGTSAALAAIKQGIEINIVHGVIRSMADLFWVSMPNSGIDSIQKLRGKKIAFTRPKSISETMIKWMLEKNGMTGQVQLVSLGSVGAGLSALESGAVDAALILEPLWSARQGRYRIAFTLAELPPITQMVGVATRTMIRNQPDTLRALVGAWNKTVNFTYDNPEAAAALISKRYGDQTLPGPVARLAVKNMVDIQYWSRGEIDIKGLEFWLQTMREQGEWEGEADWSKIIDQSMLPAALRS